MIPHAYLIGAVAVGGLALATATLYYRAESADARADAAVATAQRLQQTLSESEAHNAELRQRRKDLDAIVRERDARVQTLQAENQSRDEAYEKLRSEVAKEDQDCLSRSLPPAHAERLRN